MERKDAPRDVEELVFECLERLETEGDAALEALCRAHPEAADELRERMRLLARVGLRPAPGGAAAFPERLGDFRLIERLGAGGMGVVYLAEQVSLGRRVALKLVRPEQLYFGHARERFRREIAAIARLHHPAIVPIHASGEEAGVPYYAMEHVRGLSLDRVVAAFVDRDPTTLTGADLRGLLASRGAEAEPVGDLFVGAWREVALRVALALARAVSHAHARGVLHRDVKPSNVMIAADGRVVLLDFGLASLASDGGLTRSGSQLGSMPYMAPEQLRARTEEIGARTDVYGIGATLYEMLALRPAFPDPGDTQVLRERILDGRPRDLRELHVGVGADLALVVATAMRPDAASRYSSAAALAEDLECVLALRPIAARAPGLGARVASWARRHPARASAFALAATLVVGGPLVFGWQQRSANQEIGRVNGELRTALDEAREQRRRTDEERAIADRRLRDAIAAVDVMLTRVGQETLRNVPQMTTIRRDLLADALDFYTRFLEDRRGDPVLRNAVELARMRVSALHMTLGDLESAQRELTALVDALAPRFASDVDDVDVRATYASLVGRLGEVLARRNAFAEAETRVRASIAAYDGIPPERRDAQLELQRGGAYDKLADLLQRRGRAADVVVTARAAVAISRAGRARYPDEPGFVLALGRQLDRLGTALLRSGHASEALDPLDESVAALTAYREREPTDLHGREKLAAAHINRANVQSALGRGDEARASSLAAVELGEALVRDHPDVPSYRTDLALAHLQLFAADYQERHDDAALAHALRARDLQESVLGSRPEDATFLAELAGTFNGLAVLDLRGERAESSLAHSDRGLDYAERALRLVPKHPHFRNIVSSMHNNRGMALLALARWREAVEAADRVRPDATPQWSSCRAQLFERASRIAASDVAIAESEREVTARHLRERALDELEAAVERGLRDWSELKDPDEWTSLRAEPRFTALLAASGVGPDGTPLAPTDARPADASPADATPAGAGETPVRNGTASPEPR